MDTREKILQAAYTLFEEKGFNASTTKEIARIAKVNEITIFRIFKTKKQLFFEMLDHFSGFEDFSELFSSQLTTSYKEDLYLIAKEYMQSIKKSRKGILRTLEESLNSPEVGEMIKNSPQVFISHFCHYLEKQMNSKIIRKFPNTKLLAQSFLGMIFEFCITDIVKRSEEEYDEAIILYVDLFYAATIN